MLLHFSPISSVRLIVEDGGEIISKKSSTHPLSMSSLEREFNVLTDLQNRGVDFGLLKGQNTNFEVQERSINFRRKGTHDLSDLGHDLKVGEFFQIIAELILEMKSIHSNGYVHRDIKPGNIMVSQDKNGNKVFSGIVDFGMALRINRMQNEEGIAGGTRPFYHPSQLDKGKRSDPGQDWFSLALTCLYFMRTSVNSMEAEINSSTNGVHIDFSEIAGTGVKTLSLEDILLNVNSNFFNLLSDLIRISTSANADIVQITAIGDSLIGAAKSFIESNSISLIINAMNALPISGSPIAKHDLLLIIDETNSLSAEMNQIKSTIEDVITEFDGAMDLRVDLWTVRDYARKDATVQHHQTVRKVGYRLTARTMLHAIGEIAADAVQHDEAEAYEMAFEEAVGNNSSKVRRESLWIPRHNTTRSVVLAGDAYAHGWLRKNWWSSFYYECKTDEKSNQLKKNFQSRHPAALGKNDVEKAEMNRRRAIEKEETDQFGSQQEKVPDGRGGVQYRPNLRKVVEKLRDSKGSTIHTICLGGDVVAKSYMKFVALLGDGVTIEGKNGFGESLIGIIASPDKILYQKLLNRQNISQSVKQNLTPLTTFVLN